MSTKTYYITGPCKWAKVKTPDDYKGDKKWKVNVYLNKETKKTIKETGVPFKVREDEDGDFVVFSRPTEKIYQKDGKSEVVAFEPPKVLDKELNEIDVLIGNGSVITAKISVFDTAKGRGHRLEAIRVESLVEYEGAEQREEGAF